jgi:thymidylate synthase (FAD)
LSKEDLEAIREHVLSGLAIYKSLIERGAARESARKILPLCSQTTIYMTGSIRSWIHYLMLRTKEDTQLEHRQIAQAIQNFFLGIFPNISKALGWLSDEEEKPQPQQENITTEPIEKNTN